MLLSIFRASSVKSNGRNVLTVLLVKIAVFRERCTKYSIEMATLVEGTALELIWFLL